MREFSSIRPEVEMLLGVPYLRPLQRYGDLQQSSFEHMQHVGRQLQSDLDCLAKVATYFFTKMLCKMSVSLLSITICNIIYCTSYVTRFYQLRLMSQIQKWSSRRLYASRGWSGNFELMIIRYSKVYLLPYN